jgi:hypothetical protein
MLFLLIGCAIPDIDDYREDGIGLSVEIFRKIASRPTSYASRIGWKETTYKLDNGNWVFVQPVHREYIHWEVNPQGIIVGSSVKETSNPP